MTVHNKLSELIEKAVQDNDIPVVNENMKQIEDMITATVIYHRDTIPFKISNINPGYFTSRSNKTVLTKAASLELSNIPVNYHTLSSGNNIDTKVFDMPKEIAITCPETFKHVYHMLVKGAGTKELAAKAAKLQRTVLEGKPATKVLSEIQAVIEANKREIHDDNIKGILWDISREELPATELNRKIAGAVVDWLHRIGKFFYLDRSKNYSSAMFFNSTTKRLIRIASDEFKAWLSDQLGINRVERQFSFIYSAIEDEGLSNRATGITPSVFWESKDSAVYLSCGPGRMVKITSDNIINVDNGTDGVLFMDNDTMLPWELASPIDPFEACSIFKNMSTEQEYGKLLVKLWVCSLPTNQRTKPPLCVSGTVGSGKTRLFVGIADLLGIPARISAINKNGEADFWTAMDYGGLTCWDNADTKIDWLPDALASASTAGTLEKRKLYTDSDRVTLSSRSWVGITTSKASFASDAGLADRLLVVRLKRREVTTSDSALTNEVLQARNNGLTWLCAVIGEALHFKDHPGEQLNRRHPEFADFAVKLGRAMGCEDEAVSALREAEKDKSLFNLENDFIGAMLLDMTRNGCTFTGSAAALRSTLGELDQSITISMSARSLANRLNNLWPHISGALHATKEKDRTGSWVYTFSAKKG